MAPDSITHPDMLALIFQHLPVGVQCFTVSLVSKQWRQWAAAKQAVVQAEAKRMDYSIIGSHPLYQLPLWWVKREWRGLGRAQQQRVMERAAYHGDMATLEPTRCTGCPLSVFTTWMAAAGGQLAALQWARANGSDWGVTVCSLAARNGHLPLLQWARQDGCPWGVRTCSGAAANGHLSVLQWARQNGCPWDEDTCRAAAANGHLSVLQWARRGSCPWDEGTCRAAAEGGHLSVLQWARLNGCPCNLQECISIARQEGRDDVVQWCEKVPAAV